MAISNRPPTMFDIDRLMAKSRSDTITMNPFLDNLINQVYGDVKERLQYYHFLYYLMLEFRPKVTIELGVEYGICSAFMVEAAAIYGGTVVGIDHNRHPIPADELPRRYSKYDYIIMDTLTAATFVEERYGLGQVELVFQDSSHHFNESCSEWELYGKLLAKNAIWVCDDVTPAFHDPKVDPPGKSMVEYFTSRPGIKQLYTYAREGNAIGVILT